VTRFHGDVGVIMIARNVEGRKGFRHWLQFEASSRLVVFRPTAGAREFALRWAAQIAISGVDHDEHSMAWAFLKSPAVKFSYIDQAYSAREIGQIPGAVVAHDSAHDKMRKAARSSFKDLLRAIERPFRTGRTKRHKLRSELSVVLQA
jgi:hypothetical protein